MFDWLTLELMVWLLVAFLGGLIVGVVRLAQARAAERAQADANGYGKSDA